MLRVLSRIAEVRATVAEWRRAGESLGFVPTMGALHVGHISLVLASRRENRRTIASIFVNPLQFDRKSDLDTYPRTFDADCAMLAEAGVDAVFAPQAFEMYPDGYATRIDQKGLPDHLCGATRPGHFSGVMTVVTKLFNIVAADRAYFGKKDYQQVMIVRRMARDLDMALEVRPMPIVRETDGLAMSSRNRLLLTEHRTAAPGLYRSLKAAESAFRRGEVDSDRLRATVRGEIERIPDARIDYVDIVDPEILAPRRGPIVRGDVLAIAVFFGAVRLIDNIEFGAESPS